MDTVEKTNLFSEASPKFKARLTGVFYLLTILAGIIAQGLISGRLIISNDAAATAMNILDNESLYRAGFALYLFEMACQIVMTALFYELLKPVNKGQSLLAAFISLAGCVVKTFTRVFYLAPLFVLGNDPYLKVFNTEQLQSLAFVFLRINDSGATIALFLFGIATIIKGYLILKSTFLPKFLGVIGIIAGLGWLSFIHPPLGYQLFPFVALFGLVGSILQIFWLLAYGVNEPHWLEQASAAKQSIWN